MTYSKRFLSWSILTSALVLLNACATSNSVLPPQRGKSVASAVKQQPSLEEKVAGASTATAAKAAPAAVLEAVASSSAASKGKPETQGAKGWWATTWTDKEAVGFFGKPVSMSATHSRTGTVTVRYTYYATEYDAARHTPVWAAYTVDRSTVAADLSGKRAASNPDFRRPKFFRDPLVGALSDRLGVTSATHETFGDAMHPRYPISATLTEPQARAKPVFLERGHMVPNNAMKCSGTYEEGRVAQYESFSVANIVPQMKANNSPSWAALESACLDWANELGRVWLFVGPIYHNRDRPVTAQRRPTRENLILAVPDELYYVVVGERDGKMTAVGFKVPHRPEAFDYRAYAFPVDVIEAATGLNFMPELGEPNAMERSYDKAWLKTKARKKRDAEDET